MARHGKGSRSGGRPVVAHPTEDVRVQNAVHFVRARVQEEEFLRSLFPMPGKRVSFLQVHALRSIFEPRKLPEAPAEQRVFSETDVLKPVPEPALPLAGADVRRRDRRPPRNRTRSLAACWSAFCPGHDDAEQQEFLHSGSVRSGLVTLQGSIIRLSRGQGAGFSQRKLVFLTSTRPFASAVRHPCNRQTRVPGPIASR